MESKKTKKMMKDLISYLLIVLSVIIIRLFLFDHVRVDWPSIYITLSYKEILILNKIKYRTTDIKRYDVVVARVDNTKIIKRVIGLPGETVYCKNNQIYVNGKKIDNSFASSKTDDFSIEDIGFTKIPGDRYFVLGDNREVSLDSRYTEIGLIPKNNIIGKADIIIWPFNKVGTVK